MMMQIGQMITDGSYQAFHKEQIRSLKLSQFQGKWLVLVFYPGDLSNRIARTGGVVSGFSKARG